MWKGRKYNLIFIEFRILFQFYSYQDKEIFQTLRIKNLLTNILFVWAKLNPDISYRQGLIIAFLL